MSIDVTFNKYVLITSVPSFPAPLHYSCLYVPLDLMLCGGQHLMYVPCQHVLMTFNSTWNTVNMPQIFVEEKNNFLN